MIKRLSTSQGRGKANTKWGSTYTVRFGRQEGQKTAGNKPSA